MIFLKSDQMKRKNSLLIVYSQLKVLEASCYHQKVKIQVINNNKTSGISNRIDK